MAKHEDMLPLGCVEDDESEEEVGLSGATAHKAKPRRKSHQRPQVLLNCTAALSKWARRSPASQASPLVAESPYVAGV